VSIGVVKLVLQTPQTLSSAKFRVPHFGQFLKSLLVFFILLLGKSLAVVKALHTTVGAWRFWGI
jgi:hypothetical protein